jgi:hypothetical protein
VDLASIPWRADAGSMARAWNYSMCKNVASIAIASMYL